MKPNRPNYGTYRFPRPSLAQRLDELAQRDPSRGFVGVEVHRPGVGRLLNETHKADVTNLRAYSEDAVDVLRQAIPDAALDGVLLFFPDPWHKARHNKRRLVQDDFAAELARVLKPGGTLRFATDWADYADWALERFARTPGLVRIGNAEDGHAAPADHVVTRYEEKKLGDIPPVWLDFVRA